MSFDPEKHGGYTAYHNTYHSIGTPLQVAGFTPAYSPPVSSIPLTNEEQKFYTAYCCRLREIKKKEINDKGIQELYSTLISKVAHESLDDLTNFCEKHSLLTSNKWSIFVWHKPLLDALIERNFFTDSDTALTYEKSWEQLSQLLPYCWNYSNVHLLESMIMNKNITKQQLDDFLKKNNLVSRYVQLNESKELNSALLVKGFDSIEAFKDYISKFSNIAQF